MFGSNILEVAIGVIFVYLLLSLICTALNEGIASLIDKRGRNLMGGIKNLLNDPEFTGLAQQVYNHGLIGGISQHASNPNKVTRLPSYMSGQNFSLALLDILGARGVIAGKYGDLLANAESADDAYGKAFEAAAATPGNPQLAEAANLAKATQEQARVALEDIAGQAKTAYDEAMQSAKNAPEDAGLASAATRAKNTADTINAAIKMLDARRAAIASAKIPREARLLLTAGTTLKEAPAFARTFAAQSPDPLGNIQEGLKRLPEGDTKETLLVLVDKTRREVAAVELSWDYAGWAFYKLFGLLVSILAVSMGAPFWFDTLSKVVNLRSAGTPPGETSKSARWPTL